MKKMSALLLVLVMCFSLTACGDSSKSGDTSGGDTSGGTAEETKAEVKGTEQTWGNITALVPDGFEFTGGSTIDKEDKNTAWIQLSDDMTLYYLVTIVPDEERLNSDIAASKEINEASDITPITCGGTEWKGISYEYYDSPVFVVGATVNGKVFEVSCNGYSVDDPMTDAILASLK